MIDQILQKIFSYSHQTVVIEDDSHYTFEQLRKQSTEFLEELSQLRIQPGDSVALEGNFSFTNIALLLALLKNRNIITPVLANLPKEEKDLFKKTSQSRFCLKYDNGLVIETFDTNIVNKYLLGLNKENKPGLIIYTSGTVGIPKGAVHNAEALLSRFLKIRKPYHTLGSLLFDHIGGIDVLFTTLSSGGTFVVANDFSSKQICRLIEKNRVELFPATATLLKMILLSEDFARHDFSSVKVIAYGSEIMPEILLARLQSIFPNAILKQTFGMTELGTLSTTSRSSNSTYLKFMGKEQIRIVDNRLFIKAPGSMMGYINAPNPIDSNGWMDTEDEVEVDGEWMRILGRQTDIINIGGQKVYPSEVESVISELPSIREVTVLGEKNMLTGSIVTAHVSLTDDIDDNEIRKIIRQHCREKLAPYKVPQKIVLSKHPSYNYRFKKVRNAGNKT